MAVSMDDVDLSRDRALVERYQAGDGRAFEELYRRYFQRLVRYCRKRVNDLDEAEEIAQEAFTRAFANLDHLAGDRRFYPWLTVIASRLCIDSHRRRSRPLPATLIDLNPVDIDNEAVFASVDHTHLAAALERLTPRHREVLRLREVEGLSYKEIADHTGEALGTVEVLLWRARNALRREFALVSGERRGLGVLLPLPLLRLGRWFRDRTTSLSEVLPPVAGQAASVIAAASLSIGAVAAGPAIADRPDPAITLAAPAGHDAFAVPSDVELSSTHAPVADGSDAGAANRPAAPPDPGLVAATLDDRVQPGETPREVPPEEARTRAERSRHSFVAGPVTFGADEDAAAGDLADARTEYERYLTNKLERDLE